MAQKETVSLKQVSVDKANARIVGTTAAAGFIVVFAIVASISLVNQLTYQNRVIGVKKKAVAQLKDNLKARDDLVASYKAFVSTPQNVLDGNATGNGPKDGTNAKIVLDALPSRYDFPALASSIEKIMNDQGVTIASLTGTDDALAQSSTVESGAPKPVPIPFQVSVSGNATQIHNAMTALELSIRPFQIQKAEITGDQQSLVAIITGQTYYQPETNMNITMQVVK